MQPPATAHLVLQQQDVEHGLPASSVLACRHAPARTHSCSLLRLRIRPCRGHMLPGLPVVQLSHEVQVAQRLALRGTSARV